MTWRRAVMLVALPLMLSGCIVPPVGLAGVGVDASGAPVGYVQVCEERIDGASLHIETEDDDHGAWDAEPPVTDFASWSLTGATAGWTARTPLDVLRPGTSYRLYGWTRDNTSSASHVTFTVELLASLQPGDVMYDDFSGKPVVTDVATFRNKACQELE